MIVPVEDQDHICKCQWLIMSEPIFIQGPCIHHSYLEIKQTAETVEDYIFTPERPSQHMSKILFKRQWLCNIISTLNPTLAEERSFLMLKDENICCEPSKLLPSFLSICMGSKLSRCPHLLSL